MSSRHRSRERALQLLYQWESSGETPEAVIATYFQSLSDSIGGKVVSQDRFAEQLFHGVTGRATTLDEVIQKHAANWKLDRMALVDRNVLRIAIFEMDQGDSAPAVVIDEAIELARRFSGDKSSKFINGVLDAVRKTREASTAGD
jgi:N utilization substance protein B